MARLILLIAALGIGLILWHKINSARGAERKKLIVWSVTGVAIAIIGLLAVTGHLNIITAAIAGLVAMIPRILPLLKYLPFASRLFQQNAQSNQYTNSQPPPQRGKQTMSTEEAEEILGLKPGYSKDDIIQAHRRMMQKVHPDRGGSDYLAAQINKAKDTLLG